MQFLKAGYFPAARGVSVAAPVLVSLVEPRRAVVAALRGSPSPERDRCLSCTVCVLRNDVFDFCM
eukprot:COSAG02_NODE_637_length_19192_cov_12.648405_11_plen_65_part_00